MARSHKHEPEAFRITDAAQPLSVDISARQRRYIIMMSIRTACFIAGCITAVVGVVWLALAFMVGAIFLPYIAVVLGNTATPQQNQPSPFGIPQPGTHRRELPPQEDQQ